MPTSGGGAGSTSGVAGCAIAAARDATAGVRLAAGFAVAFAFAAGFAVAFVAGFAVAFAAGFAVAFAAGFAVAFVAGFAFTFAAGFAFFVAPRAFVTVGFVAIGSKVSPRATTPSAVGRDQGSGTSGAATVCSRSSVWIVVR
jgi:hypothetical protein